MNHRTLTILLAVAVASVAGLMMLGRPTMATELPANNGPASRAPTPLNDPADGVLKPDAHPIQTAEGSFRRNDQVEVAEAARKKENTTGWTSGIIRGDIKLSVSALDRLGSISVHVEEMRSGGHDGNPDPPWSTHQSVERGVGTPTFEVRDIPFSNYPYRVYVRAAGLNGGVRTLSITAEDPLHEVQLAITPGLPLSVLLRDQDGAPHANVDVHLRPVGKPFGRPAKNGTSDNFGTVVFEDVLEGGYDLVALQDNQQLGEVERVNVQPGSRSYGRAVQPQGHVMVIPRGAQIDVLLSDGFYPVAGAKVVAVKTDTRQLHEPSGETDEQGRLRFVHLKPGRWMLTITHPDYHRHDRPLSLKADQLPEELRIKLTRRR